MSEDLIIVGSPGDSDNGAVRFFSSEDCRVELLATTLSAETCPGASDGSITVQVDTATADSFTYTLTGPVEQTNATGEFTGLPAGDYTVTVSVTDDPSCTVTSEVLTVAPGVDDVPPVAIAQDLTVQLDATGSVTITAEEVDGGSSDDCGIASLALDRTSFACGDVGDNAIVLTVTDVNGNSSTAPATVTVEDNVAPVAIAQDVTLRLDASGRGVLTASDVDGGSSDVCGIVARYVDRTNFSNADLGPNPVRLTVTDAAGNVSTAPATVTVEEIGTLVQSDLSGVMKRTALDGQDGDNFGWSTDISGDLAIVGAYQDDDQGEKAGSAYILGRNAGGTDQWGQVAKLSATDGSADDYFGFSVAISGDLAVVGAYYADDKGDNSGAAYVFARHAGGPDQWGQVAKLTAADGAAGDWFGYSVGISGEQVIIGAMRDDDNGGNSGAAYLFSRDTGGSDQWGQVAKLTASDARFADSFGWSVAISGDKAVVGALFDDDNGTDSGSAYVFARHAGGAEQWGQVKKLVPADGTAYAAFGNSVAISGDQVIVGAYQDDDNGFRSGSAYIFDRNQGGIDYWGQVTKLTADDGTADDFFGWSVGIDADRAIVGSIFDDDLGSASGSAYLFARHVGGTDQWGPVVKLTACDGESNDLFGSHVGISGSQIIVGANLEDANGNDAGAAYFYGPGGCGLELTGSTISGESCPHASDGAIAIQVGGVSERSLTFALNGPVGQTNNTGHFSGLPPGDYTVTVTLDDNICCTVTSGILTVAPGTDAAPPNVVTQDLMLHLDENGNASITANQIDNGSTDACGIASLSLDRTTFGCGDIGENEVILTVTDVNGNSSTAPATVTVEDHVAPVAIAQDITVQLDATGNATITAAQIDNRSTDACGIASISLDRSTFDCGDVGDNAVVLTVTDVNGNSSTAPATVTVEDNVAPIAVTQDLTVQLDANGNASITASQIDNGSSDACGIATLALDRTTFGCADVGVNTVVLTVTDMNGNSSSAPATVTVEDNVAPVAIAQDITLQLDANGNATITASQIDNGSSDACGIASLSLDRSIFGCADVGENPVVLTVTDVNGNSSTAPATVTVEDHVAPVAIAQNLTVQLDATGNATITAAQIDNGSSDACGIASLALDRTTFGCADVGVNTVVLTVTDMNGNSSSAPATVTVEDNVAPVAIAQDITLQLDANGNATITASQIDNGSSDACGIASLSLDRSTFGCGDIGDNPVVLTITDVNGNSSTAPATVTVEDNVPPVAIAQDITVQLDANGNATITAAQIDNGSNDACGIASLSLDRTSYGCADVGLNPVVLTVTDVNGNSSTASATVTVEDNVAPVAIAQDITVQLDANGNATITAAQIDNGSSDACGIASLALDRTTFDCADVGTNPVVLTVTDVNGNESSAPATVIVEDNVAPVAIAQNITVQLDGTGNATITAGQIDNGSHDACGVASISLDRTIFGCADVGENPVVVTVTDVNGNSSTAPATVTVEDNVAPVAIAQDLTVQLDANGNASITASQINNGSNDACGIATLALDRTTFGCGDVGDNAVVLTVTDVNGNSSTAPATVNVEDNVAPVAVAQDITVQLDVNGNATITATQIDNGSSDACGIASLSLDRTSFGCADVGDNAVILTVTDVNGNSSTAPATVTVEDNVAPVADCQPLTIYLSSEGTYTLSQTDAEAIGGGSSDACGIASLTVPATQFTAAGTYPVTLTATDNHGNASTCATTATVVKRPTTLTYTGDDGVQYSDELALSAVLRDQLTGSGIAGQTVTFTLGSQTISAVTDANGLATAALTVDQQPSAGCATDPATANALTVAYAETDIYRSSESTVADFPIAPEDARVTYTGASLVSTTSVRSGQADVLLAVTVQDISATADAGGDGKPGDISLATVDFIDRDGGVINPSPIPVSLVDPTDPSTGVAVYNWTGVDIGNADSEQFAVGVRVCGYYSRNTSEDDVIVTVSKPLEEFVTGGGYLNLQQSVGPIAGDPGTKQNFGFNIRYNKRGTNLQGKIRLLIRRTEADGLRHTYQIKGNSMSSLSVDPATGEALFYGKANVQDVTDPNNPVSVFGNGDFQVRMWDNGEPGTNDLIGFTLYDNQGNLQYSSHWTGTATGMQFLGGGNLQVHAKGVVQQTSSNQKGNKKDKATDTRSAAPSLTVYPVPTEGEITVALESAVPGRPLRLTVTDVHGRMVKDIHNLEHRQRIDLSALPDGMYLLHLLDDSERLETHRIVKH
ncbi:T9SS type A sorting domain-containing protein [Neolewinella litorea]|uniref:T9SS type A sorting domain-containing protein n=1 Tax=Neolewinella litorea TaxID=2562452 RepID=UPI001FE9C185|nr:T9SS type A sorting domain-containing protein [Neolewinella litorea]